MAKKMKSKFIAFISIAVSLAAVTATAFTVAAFVNSQVTKQDINVSLSYNTYFGGGNGTAETPYLITTAEHLDNLSKLTRLGCFNEKDNFKLNNNIDWSTLSPARPMKPIGTIDTPFYSTFDGGNFTISNLNVNADDEADVGMFGYVAGSGVIKNYILDTPVVESGTKLGTTAFNNADMQTLYAGLDTNPLRQIITESMCKGITTVPTYKTSGDNKTGLTSISIKLDSLFSNSNYQFDFNYKCSNNKYIKTIGFSNNKTLDVSFKTSGLKEADSGYFVLEIYTKPIIELPGKPGEFRLVSYCVERFKFYYDAKIGAVISNPTNPKVYKKIMHPAVESELAPIEGGTNSYFFNDKVINAGVVVGYLCGKADQIAVYNPTLTMKGRPFESNTMLIGRKIDDDNRSLLSKETANMDVCLNGGIDYQTIGEKLSFDSNTKNTDNADGNFIVGNIYGDDSANKIRPQAKDVIRIFTRNSTMFPVPQNGKENGVVKVIHNYNNGVEEIPTNFLSFQEDMDNVVIAKPFFIYKHPDALAATNALQMWTTLEDVNSPLAKILKGSNNGFFLNIEFEYLFFDDDYASVTDYSNKTLKVVGIRKAAKGVVLLSPGRYEKPLLAPDEETNHPMDNVATASSEKGITANDFKYGYVNNLNEKGELYEPLKFSKAEISGTTEDAKTKSFTKLNKKVISIKNTKDAISGSLSALFANYTPLFLIGMSSPNNGGYQLDIKSINIIISDINGNYAGEILKVDFSDSASYPMNGKKWDSSNTRVTTNLYQNSYKQADNLAAPTIIGLKPGVGDGYATYTLSASRAARNIVSSGDVTITYSIVDANGTTLTVVPENQEGYVKAKFKVK